MDDKNLQMMNEEIEENSENKETQENERFEENEVVPGSENNIESSEEYDEETSVKYRRKRALLPLGAGAAVLFSMKLTVDIMRHMRGYDFSMFLFLSTVILDSLFILTVYFLVARKDGPLIMRKAPSMGFMDFKKGVRLLLTVMSLNVIYSNIITRVSPGLADRLLGQGRLVFQYSDDPIQRIFQIGLMFISLVVIAPICEEIVFRGVLMNYLNDTLNVGLSIAVSSFFFGVLHGGTFFQTAMAGVVLAFVYHVSGSLRLSMGIHALNNFIAFVGTLLSNYIEGEVMLNSFPWDYILGLVGVFLIVGIIGGTIITLVRIIRRRDRTDFSLIKAAPLYRNLSEEI